MFLDKILPNKIAKVTRDISEIYGDIESSNKLLLVLGRAGTGKSTLLRKLCKETRKKYVILAPTGIATVNVGGQTVHSFFKFKPGILYEEAEKQGMRNQNEMYEKLELLVIDEVSMLRADLLDCIDIFLKRARRSLKPFGGVQIVLFGDLYQLEPVVTGDEKELLYKNYESPYFFSSWIFGELLKLPEQIIEFVELTKVFRQKDEDFITLLDKIRKKKVDDYDLDTINRQFDEYITDTKDDHIYLTTRNDTAERINSNNLNLIDEPERSFIGKVEGDFPEKLFPTALDIRLKVGSRIMLLNNDTDKRWINGTLGVVVKIDKDAIHVRLDSGRDYVIMRYIWSYYKYFFDKTKQKIIKEIIGSYTQFPIKLAWAITIHKSQGQTFDKAIIWMEGRAFANGQVYVALSRCRTLEGIVLNRPIQHFDIMTDDKVKKFLIQIKKYVASWRLSPSDKEKIIKEAIKKNLVITITYLTLEEDMEEYTLRPSTIEEIDEESVVRGRNVKSGSEEVLRLAQVIDMFNNLIKSSLKG